MNPNTIIDKAIRSLDALAESVTTTAQAGHIKSVRDALEELRADDPATIARRLLAKLGMRLETIMEKGVQCIGADGLPLYDDGKAVMRDANKGELSEVRTFIDKHGGFRRDTQSDDYGATDEAAERRGFGVKKSSNTPVLDTDYDAREEQD